MSCLAAQAAVPAAVGSSLTTFASGLGANPNKMVFDAAGNLFVLDAGHSRILKFPVNNSQYTEISAPGAAAGLSVDTSGNLYYCDLWSSNVWQIPFVAGQYGAAQKFITDLYGTLGTYWIPTMDFVQYASDANYDYFILLDFDGSVYQVKHAKLGGALTGTSLGSVAGWAGGYVLATDSKGDVFAVDSGALYKISGLSATMTKVADIPNALSVGVDGSGNVYVSDTTNNAITVVPNENGNLNAADKYLMYSGTVIANVAFDPKGRMVLPVWDAINYLSLTNVQTPAKAVGTTSDPATISYVFNTDVTPSFQYRSKGASGEFSNPGGAACGSAYSAGQDCSCSASYTAGQSCTTKVTATAVAPGARMGAVLMLDGSNNLASMMNVTGMGIGGGLVLDPGTQVTYSNAATKPSALAMDSAGNLYVADTAATSILKIPAGGGAATNIGSGLMNPSGVAVDGAGNLYVSDTGNDRVVMIPDATHQFVLTSDVKSPEGIAVDSLGNLYIADTGNIRVLKLTRNPFDGSYATSTIGSGFASPSAVTVDDAGNVYIADTGAGKIVAIEANQGSQIDVIIGLGWPSALATDAAGGLYVADATNQLVTKYPLQNGGFSPSVFTWLGRGLTNPRGVVLDPAGNVFISDMDKSFILAVNRLQPTLDFGSFNVGDSSEVLTSGLYSIGNQPVTIAGMATSGDTADFTVNSSNCAAATLATGTACNITAQFIPTALNARAASVSIQSDALNASQIGLTLSGTGTNLTGSTITIAMTVPATGNPTFGAATSFSADVAPASGTGAPTGKVVFYVDGVDQPAVTLASGAATFTTSSLLGGSHAVIARYEGDTTYASSVTSEPLVITVGKATPTVSAQATSDGYGAINTYNNTDSATLSVIVGAPIKTIPTGEVEFFDGTNSLGTVALVAGRATLKLPVGTLSDGSHQLKAVYSGDTNFLAVNSATFQVTVTPAPTFDFASDVSSATVVPGQNGLYTLSITNHYNFGQLDSTGSAATVQYSCAGIVDGNNSDATSKLGCVFVAAGSTSVYLNRITVAPVNGVFPTVTLQLASTGPGNASASLRSPSHLGGLFYALLAPGIFGLVSIAAERRKFTLKVVSFVLLLAVVALSMIACGANNGQLPSQSTKSTGTAAATYTATIQATSLGVGTLSPSVTKTIQVKLTVK